MNDIAGDGEVNGLKSRGNGDVKIVSEIEILNQLLGWLVSLVQSELGSLKLRESAKNIREGGDGLVRWNVEFLISIDDLLLMT